MATPNSPDSGLDTLKRFIYLCNTEGKYYCGGPNKQIPEEETYVKALNMLLRNSQDILLKVLEEAYSDRYLPHKVQVFRILAILLTLEEATEKNKPMISALAEKLCEVDKDLFEFIKAVVLIQQKVNKKIPTTARKSILRYYNNKDAEDLAKSYVIHKSYCGWKHKDIIKFFRVKSETTAKNLVVNYILFGKSKEPTGEAVKEAEPFLELMKKSDLLRSTQDPKIAVPLIKELKATINQVEPGLRKSAEVWNEALQFMTLQDILQCLIKLYKLGFLKKDTPTQSYVNKCLTDESKIKSSGIHPIEVFIHMKNFEKGGKPLDPKLLHHLKTDKHISDEDYERLKTPSEVKCPSVLSSLQKCMNLACNNVQPTGKRYLITVDTTERMDIHCLGAKNLTGIEVAAAFVWLFLKVEKDVTVAFFNDKEICVINLDKKAHLYEHVQRFRDNKSKYLVLASPMEWAATHKKHFDIFINFIHHKEYYATIPKEIRDKMASPVESLEKYRKRINLPNAKLVTFCLSSPKMVVAQGKPNVLDIAGLDKTVPRVLEAFCRNKFQ